jgi:hypothetical protein
MQAVHEGVHSDHELVKPTKMVLEQSPVHCTHKVICVRLEG